VIECPQDFKRGELIDLERLRQARNAIWNAAVLAYRSGERAFLDHADQVASNRRNGTCEQEHRWQASLAAWIQHNGGTPFTNAEALIGAGCRFREQIGRKEVMDAASELKTLGLQRGRQSRGPGGIARRWHLSQPSRPVRSSDQVVTPTDKNATDQEASSVSVGRVLPWHATVRDIFAGNPQVLPSQLVSRCPGASWGDIAGFLEVLRLERAEEAAFQSWALKSILPAPLP